MKPQHINRAALLLTAFMVLQKILALVQQIMIARVTSLGSDADAFYCAQMIPLLVGGWISLSLTTALIPMLKTWSPAKIAGIVVSLMVLLMAGSLVIFLFAAPFTKLFGNGLAQATMNTATRLLREMSLMLFLMGVTGILTAQYYFRMQFLIPCTASCLPYVGGIGSIIFFQPSFGIDALAWGMVAGIIAQAVVLCAFMDRASWARPDFSIDLFGVFSKSCGSILIASAVGILWMMIDRAFASYGRAGTVAAVTVASSFMTIPSALVVSGLNSALLPALVMLREDSKAFAAMLRHAVSYMVFFLAPASIVMFLGSDVIIKLLFHSANLSRQGIASMTALIAAYSFAVLGMALKDVLTVAAIALNREWIAMLTGVAIMGVSIAIKLVYRTEQSVTWIASSTSISMWVGAGLLVLGMSMLMNVGWWRLLIEDGWRLALANAAFVLTYLALNAGLHFDSVFGSVAVLCAGALAYLIVSWLLRLNFTRRTPEAADRSELVPQS